MLKISEKSILKHFDNSIIGDYNDFIDLGHGYYELANCRLTLFKDNDDWAMVFEKFAYNARAGQPVQIQISFFGNCLKDKAVFNGKFSNFDFLDIENDICEVIEKQEDTITIRGHKVKIPTKLDAYQKMGIDWDFDGKIYVGAVLKYLSETYPDLTRATENEIRRCLPENLSKIMTIDDWFQEEYHQFAPTILPSQQETFQLIAKVLVSGDTKLYKPTTESNTHWRFWLESGNM